MTRLSAQAWLDHGLQELARIGPVALKADTLSKSLRVSRGSFYWHFDNLDSFKKSLLQYWRATTTEAVIADLDSTVSPEARLKKLVSLAHSKSFEVDRAVRSWALQDERVMKVLAEVDELRVDYIRRLLIDGGLTARKARIRAVYIYAAALGAPLLIDNQRKNLTQTALTEIVDLLHLPEA